jgi:formylglycine-generating enzyme required for sulfatase activity
VNDNNSGRQTADVGSKPGGASWVGALDMAGNVWQWTSSLYQAYPYQKGDGRESSIDTDSSRVLRGGSCFSHVDDLRSAFRIFVPPDDESVAFGFRCARAS